MYLLMNPPLDLYPEPLWTLMGLGQAYLKHVHQMYSPLDLYPEPLWTPLGLRCRIRDMEGMIFGLA